MTLGLSGSLNNALQREYAMSLMVVNARPFQCRWIERGSEVRVSNWSYALCQRLRANPRYVTEWECAVCPRWEAPSGPDVNQES